MFSSLLGVWQSVPYVFADYCTMLRAHGKAPERTPVDSSSALYRGYLYALAIVPMLALRFGFREVQKYYAIIGALFIPFLAVALLYLNGREKWVGKRVRNRPLTVLLLAGTLLFFAFAGWLKIRGKFFG